MLESYKGKNNLLDINWYLSKMSMFLKESYGIIDEVKWDVDLLNNINDVCDSIMYSFDIFNNFFEGYIDEEGKFVEAHYEDYMQYLDNKNKDFLALDIIASLVGISRKVKINNTWIGLNNYDLWQYIRITIAKNNFKGTNEEIVSSYKNIGIIIYYLTTGSMTCSVKVNSKGLSENIKNLFIREDHPLIIQSVGINYDIDFFSDNTNVFVLDEMNNLDNYDYRLV